MSSSSPPAAKRTKLSNEDIDVLLGLSLDERGKQVAGLFQEDTALGLQALQAINGQVELLKSEASAAKVEASAAKAEASSVKVQLAEAERLLNEERFRSVLLVGTPTVRAKNIQTNVTMQAHGGFPWLTPSQVAIASAWKSLQCNAVIRSEPIFASEDEDMHPAVSYILGELQKFFRRYFSMRERPSSLSNPLLSPDIVIGKVGIGQFSWADIHMLFELKLPPRGKDGTGSQMQEAIAQVVKYLDAAVTHRPPADTYRVAIACDFCSIETFFTANKISRDDLVRSETLELFPVDWKKRQAPTPGFALLCHALVMPMPASEKILINGISCPVVGTLQPSDDMAAYIVQPPNGTRLVAVKVALGKMAMGVMHCFEKPAYVQLSAMAELAPFMVKHLSEYNVENGYAMELAEPLIRWFEKKVEEDGQNAKLGRVSVANTFVKPHLLRVFEALCALHNCDWSHRDIRPANIVLLEGTARLIDWSTAAPNGRPVDTLFNQGFGDPFAPEDVSKFGQDGAKLDLVGLGYVALFFGSSADMEKACADPEKRKRYMDMLLNSSRGSSPTDLATIGAKLVHEVENTGVQLLTNADYDRWGKMFA